MNLRGAAAGEQDPLQDRPGGSGRAENRLGAFPPIPCPFQPASGAY